MKTKVGHKWYPLAALSLLFRRLSKGIKGQTLAWFKSYLKDRVQIVDINGSLSFEKIFNISVIQGSILGPILFLIYINDLYRVTDLLTLMFADDTASVGSDTNISRLTSHINVELAKMARWFHANKMAVNVDKTKFIIFHTRGNQFNADEV
jgi:hypothetical protein